MMTYDEVMEAIERGFIKGDKISIIRRNGKIHDYVLPGEKVEPGEIVEKEDLNAVLEELKEF
ncbi:MAG: Paratox [Streptococcus salivarius]|jgi:ADP-ribose pyrophosphatase YjhB (NUDIX family)|uniref:competence regulator inhibitor paratox n=1 Tax=Streptococcus TaxID=1301 RepID=UPI000E50775C|nr:MULTISPECIES: Paratox [Streptococcus]MBK5079675.1 Paratox [Streptococcus sp. 22.1]RGQ15336.1 Paratox [Streptococcus salivarius]